MNVTQLFRQKRIGQLRNTIIEASKQGKVSSFEKMVAYLMSNHYLTRRTAVEYVNSAIDGDRIIKDGDEVFAPKDELADIEKEADEILKPLVDTTDQ